MNQFEQIRSSSVSDRKRYNFKRGQSCPIVQPSLPEPLVSTTPKEATSENGHMMNNNFLDTGRGYIDLGVQVRPHVQ